MEHTDYLKDAVELLKALIAAPSISREEDKAADAMVRFVIKCGFDYKREINNVWVIDPHFDAKRPTLLLNAHLDTVKAVDSWTHHPFTPEVEGDTIYGLGSNDCGGGLVSLLQTFRMLVRKPQKYNVIYLASAEEEISGKNGIEKIIPMLPPIDVAIVGEPTGLQPAIAEKGLMVLDITSHGKSGHAARNEGINAIYEAIDDIQWFKNYRFLKDSDVLGPTHMNVTIINAGTQHNVIPDKCTFTVDVRSNENYTNQEIYDFICSKVKSEVKARSFRLCSSHISINHPLMQRALSMKLMPFGSPTLSDQALMPFPSFKLGPGESCRSHAADEFIRISEIDKAIDLYFTLLDGAEIK